jgi:hypothetical protein
MSANVEETYSLKALTYNLEVRFYKIELILKGIFDIPKALDQLFF